MEVHLRLGRLELPGTLTLPAPGCPVVLFAHGSGSSRQSPRNQYVAGVINAAGLGTLLFDLLTASEERARSNVFDVALLAGRLLGATRWLITEGPAGVGPETRIGYFGASTGAAAALWAAADVAAEAGGSAAPVGVGAVVSRGGRPDLAGPRLAGVRAPTRLVVGSRDEVVLDLNRDAQRLLTCENDLVVVPGATHLFEEPGTLDLAANAARDWFVLHLLPGQGSRDAP